MAALCEEYGVSRKTGYKWLQRFVAGGPAGLVERSRARKQMGGRHPAPVFGLAVLRAV